MRINIGVCEFLNNEKFSIDTDYHSHTLWSFSQWKNFQLIMIINFNACEFLHNEKNVNDNDNQYQLACEFLNNVSENHYHLGLIIIITVCEILNNEKM